VNKPRFVLDHMTRLYSAIIFTVVILMCSSEAPAQVASSFTKLFRLEQYNEAFVLIEPLTEKQLHPAKKSYLLGLCSSRLRKYDEAILHFREALKKGAKDTDLNYEYGQALFANNNLAQAREEFKKSAAKNFNYIASIYYVAHISEILEDDVAAKHNSSTKNDITKNLKRRCRKEMFFISIGKFKRPFFPSFTNDMSDRAQSVPPNSHESVPPLA
jgi:tetratricopeptide (TPR) repeat protein